MERTPIAQRAADLARRAVAHASARDLHFTLLFIAVLLPLQFSPVLGQEGWPLNQETVAWKHRILIYAAHLSRLDLLPVWAESAASGLGAPLPILYHKLFYFLAGPLYLVLGSVKATVVASLAAFCVLGLLGMREVLSFLGVPRRTALVAAAAFAFCNYAYTDWVVRGAFAEYSAMMLLPWLFRWLSGVLEGESPARLRGRGMLIIPALYLAHAGLFYFSALPVLGAVAWRLGVGRDRRAFFGTLLAVAGTFSAVALPISLCQLLLVRELSFAEGIGIFAPRDYFSTLTEHLTGGQFHWGEDWEAYSVQLDMPLVAIACLGLTWRIRARMRAGEREQVAAATATPTRLRSYVGCWLAVAYFAFLLTPWSLPLYEHAPGFNNLQFPWRLLAFLSVCSVLLAAIPLLEPVRPLAGNATPALAWVMALVTYACSPWLRAIHYEWLPTATVEQPLPATPALLMGSFEYHPKVAGVPGARLIEYLEGLQPPPTAIRWNFPAYTVQRTDHPSFEMGMRTYRIRAAEPTTVILPVVYSPFTHVELVTASERRRLETHEEPSDPRLHVDLPPGESSLEVRFPTFASFYWDLLTR